MDKCFLCEEDLYLVVKYSFRKIIKEKLNIEVEMKYCPICGKPIKPKVVDMPTLEDIVGNTFIYEQDEWVVLEFALGGSGEYKCVNKNDGIIKYFPIYKTYDRVIEYKDRF